MNINKESMAGDSVLVIGSKPPNFISNFDVKHIISVGVCDDADVVFQPECTSRIEGVEIWCHRGPSCVKGINKISKAADMYMSIRNDKLPEDPDLAVLNLAILSGASNISLVGFRDPRDEKEDKILGDWLTDYAPQVYICCDNEKWHSFDHCAVLLDDVKYEFSDTLSDDEEWFCDIQGAAAIVCGYRSGGDFDLCPREYVHRLYSSCAKHISKKLKWKFFVITDSPKLFIDMPVIPITMSSDLERWHVKFEIFRTELWREYSSVICMDLDTIVVGDISNMITAKIEFGLLSDIYRVERPATGIIIFRPDPKYRYIYEYIMEHKPDQRTWDVYPLLECLEHLNVVPERLQKRFVIKSWKADLHGKSGTLTPMPHDTQIVVWHGKPRPHECKWELPPKEKPPEIEWTKIQKMAVPRTIYIIGGGPSLRNNNPDDYLNRSDCVLATNDAYKFKCASVCLFADLSWWRVHKSNLEEWDGRIWTTAAVDHPKLHHIKKERAWLSKDPSWIAWNACTGWAALNMALLAGADRIVLIGFDMQFGSDESSNWHRNIRRLKANTFNSFRWRAKALSEHIRHRYKEIEIVVSEPTALTEWPIMPIADAVAWGREEREKPSNMT